MAAPQRSGKTIPQRLYAKVPSFTINLVLLQSDRNT